MACFDMKKSRGCRVAAQGTRTRDARRAMPSNYAVSRQNGFCEPLFYCGPCGPVEPTNDCTGLCPPGSVPPVYKLFEQTGSLTLAAGEAIPFEEEPAREEVERLVNDDGVITIQKAGVYMAILTLMLPADTAEEDVVSLRLNGEELPGGRLNVNQNATDSARQISAQAVFRAASGDTLRAVSEQGISLTADAPDGRVAALTVVKVG